MNKVDIWCITGKMIKLDATTSQEQWELEISFPWEVHL